MHGVMTRRRGPPASADQSRSSASTSILVSSDKTCSARNASILEVVHDVGQRVAGLLEGVADVADFAEQPVRVLGDVDKAPAAVKLDGLVVDGVNDHEPGGGRVAGRNREA